MFKPTQTAVNRSSHQYVVGQTENIHRSQLCAPKQAFTWSSSVCDEMVHHGMTRPHSRDSWRKTLVCQSYGVKMSSMVIFEAMIACVFEWDCVSCYFVHKHILYIKI